MAVAISTLTENWDEALAAGVGIVLTDVVGDTVSGYISEFVPAKWLDPVTEMLIGVGILIFGEWFAPAAYKAYTRLASYGALGIGIADAIGIMLGFSSCGHSSSSEGSSGGQGSQQSQVKFL